MNSPARASFRIANDSYLKWLYESELEIIKELIDFNYFEANPGIDIVEIGSAGGNTKSYWPSVITTDVRASPEIDKVMSGESLQFIDNSLDVIFGLDALHHLRDPEKHFKEVLRTLKVGGIAVYIEPNWNKFSFFCFKFLLKYLHPEPYDTKSKNWKIENLDPMMGNQSQAYNIFVRDYSIFASKFPDLGVEILQPLKGITFLVSGGVHTRLPIPGKILISIAKIENSRKNWLNHFGLGRVIKLTRLN